MTGRNKKGRFAKGSRTAKINGRKGGRKKGK